MKFALSVSDSRPGWLQSLVALPIRHGHLYEQLCQVKTKLALDSKRRNVADSSPHVTRVISQFRNAQLRCISRMIVNSLLVSRDRRVQSAVADVFAGIDLKLREDFGAALDAINTSHFDGFVVDCDGIERGPEIIGRIRESRGNRKSVIFAIVSGTTSISDATAMGANFVLRKPLEITRLTTYVRSSICKMEAEHRRYFRYQLTLDAEVIRRDRRAIAAQVFNVSSGGVALRLLDRALVEEPVTIRFTIPSGKTTRVISAMATVCWANETMLGMKFFGMDEASRTAYDLWLSSMTLM